MVLLWWVRGDSVVWLLASLCFRGAFVVSLWQAYYVASLVMPWTVHGAVMLLPWQGHGTSMGNTYKPPASKTTACVTHKYGK